jgi:hypothetical protein
VDPTSQKALATPAILERQATLAAYSSHTMIHTLAVSGYRSLRELALLPLGRLNSTWSRVRMARQVKPVSGVWKSFGEMRLAGETRFSTPEWERPHR